MAADNDRDSRRIVGDERYADDPHHPNVHLLPLDEIADDYIPTPRFLREDASHRYARWVPVPVQRICTATIKWGKGPAPPPRIYNTAMGTTDTRGAHTIVGSLCA